MAKFNYALFYDFHTMTTVPDVGENFDVERFTDEIKRCGVDFLTWHARCNQGGAYYNTKIGIRHPGLKYDLFGKIAEACRRKGIRLSAYFNAGLSDEELLGNPDWMVVHPDGRCLREPRLTPYVRTACYNSGFAAHLREMALELLEMHPVDGFFFDCITYYPCVCRHCVAKMKERGIDFNDPQALIGFSRESYREMCRDLAAAIRAKKPDALIFFNCEDKESLDPLFSHFECECLPTGGWGYDYLPIFAHYLRTMAGPDRTVLNMTGRFYNWGDFGGLRSAPGLEYDLLYGMAHGMRPDIGGHFHPRGDLDLPVFDRIAEVYGEMKKYDRWVIDAENDADVAVVFGKEQWNPVKAAVRMLDELKIQFDVVTEHVSWEKYKLLILPDNLVLSEEGSRRLMRHLREGGKIVACAGAGLWREAFLPEWPALYAGKTPYDPVYFAPSGELAKNLPSMTLSVYASAVRALPVHGSQVEMNVVKPYMNQAWDGVRSNYYTPPEKVTEDVFIARNDSVVFCAGEICTGYFNRSPYQLRQLLGNMIDAAYGTRKFSSKTLPSFARAVVQKKENCELIHLLAYAPDARCSNVALEDRITLCDTEVELRLDGRKIRGVRQAPDGKILEYSVEGDVVTIRLPRMDGYALIIVEYAE